MSSLLKTLQWLHLALAHIHYCLPAGSSPLLQSGPLPPPCPAPPTMNIALSLYLLSPLPSAHTWLHAFVHAISSIITPSLPFLFCSYTPVNCKFCEVFACCPLFQFPPSEAQAPCSVLPCFCWSSWHNVLLYWVQVSFPLDCESLEGKGNVFFL